MFFSENSINVQTSINHYELIDKQIKKLDNQKPRVLRLHN